VDNFLLTRVLPFHLVQAFMHDKTVDSPGILWSTVLNTCMRVNAHY